MRITTIWSKHEILTDEPYDTANDLARPGFLFVDLFRTGCLRSESPFGPCRQANDDGGRRDPKECLLHLYTGHDLAWPNCLEADEIEI
jgi:hypothetical protein